MESQSTKKISEDIERTYKIRPLIISQNIIPIFPTAYQKLKKTEYRNILSLFGAEKIYSYQQTTLLLTAQTKYYTFRIPYDSEFAVKLQNILNSNINQSDGSALFQLKYYDGTEVTQEAPYTAGVTILKGSSTS